MRGIKLHTQVKANTRIAPVFQGPFQMPPKLQEQINNASSCRSCSVKLPHSLRGSVPRGVSEAQSIKAAIHKLRTESPQFSYQGYMQGRSRSSFFENKDAIKKEQQKPLQILAHRSTHLRKEGRSYLPQLHSNQIISHNSPSTKPESPREDCNVILLKRNMRYRLQRLPLFERTHVIADPQLNQSLTGWHRNPQQVDDFSRHL